MAAADRYLEKELGDFRNDYVPKHPELLKYMPASSSIQLPQPADIAFLGRPRKPSTSR